METAISFDLGIAIQTFNLGIGAINFIGAVVTRDRYENNSVYVPALIWGLVGHFLKNGLEVLSLCTG